MKFNLWDILRTGQISIPTPSLPHFSIVGIMKEEHMNFLDFIHLPSWVPFALWALGAVLVLIALGALKSLIGGKATLALFVVLAFASAEVDGARRAHDHYNVKGPWVFSIPAIFL